jgi:hypothetical protein
MNYSEAIQSLSESLLVSFDEVYHSAQIITNDKGVKMPAIAFGDEWLDLVPTDQKETLYIRRNGEDEVLGDLKIGSCTKAYYMRSTVRIVYFKDHAKNHAEILSKLLQSVLIGGTKLKSVIQDKFKLLKEESSGDYNFGASTAYFAIDLYVLWELKPDNCEYDFCLDITNPLKKESCPVAVSES